MLFRIPWTAERLFNVCHVGICKFIITTVTVSIVLPAAQQWMMAGGEMCFLVSRSGVWIELNQRSREIVTTTLGDMRVSPLILSNRRKHTANTHIQTSDFNAIRDRIKIIIHKSQYYYTISYTIACHYYKTNSYHKSWTMYVLLF